LARICPAKGFHLLVDAFVRLREHPEMSTARLRAAGWLGDADRPYFQEQLDRLRQAGMADDFHYAGILDRPAKLHFLQSIDVLSVPTIYQEPKGRYVLEALAGGVPVVQPEHGAFPELLSQVGGGRLFPPGDATRLAEVLVKLLTQHDLRRQLGREGHQVVHSRCGAKQIAQQTIAALRGCIDTA
jgi:glycosyltransferase involved in cell wall biosynthesis